MKYDLKWLRKQIGDHPALDFVEEEPRERCRNADCGNTLERRDDRITKCNWKFCPSIHPKEILGE